MGKPITITSLYLTAYNLAAAIGWALVLRTVFISYQAKHTPTVLWSHVGDLLVLVQTSAALEMIHSLFRLVRSPFMGTFMQVMSRLFLIHVVTLRSMEAQAHWSLYLMIVSWSLVEIPRYLFYTVREIFINLFIFITVYISQSFITSENSILYVLTFY